MGSLSISTEAKADLIGLLMDPEGQGAWRDLALCRGSRVRFHSPNADEHRAARFNIRTTWAGPAYELCEACPVRLDCLEHALAMVEWGIWAGTTYDERKFMRSVRAGNRPSPGNCPDCKSPYVTRVAHSSPIKVRCVMCNYRWTPQEGQ